MTGNKRWGQPAQGGHSLPFPAANEEWFVPRLYWHGGAQQQASFPFQASERAPCDLNEMKRGREEVGFSEARHPPLPEELVEKIVSLMPFPSILKARMLSKAWAAKFQSLQEEPSASGRMSCETGEEDQGSLKTSAAVTPLLRLVMETSSTWDSFCPAFLLRDSFDVIAYSRRTNSWKRIHSLSYLPHDFVRQDITAEGSLVCGSVVEECNVREHNLYVTNVLTRAYRVLPLPPNMTPVGCKHLLQQGADGYTVVVFSLDPHCRQNDPYTFDAQVYNSKIHTWKTTKVTIEHDFYMSPQCSAYLNKTLYIVSRHGLGVLSSGEIGILALNVEDLSWEMFYMSFPSLSRPCTSVTMVLCGGQILVVLSLDVEPPRTWLNLWDKRHRMVSCQHSLLVMKVDLKNRQLALLTQGPPVHLSSGPVHNNPVTDGKYIYFGAKTSGSVVAYDVERDEWSSIPSMARSIRINRGFQWNAFSFRPGLNSFLAV
ncbi:hypothetical protein R1sor_006366 [Riccia sorocarpa]|uniref:F-box domain-containing protein n=1 Tax=Riccia sorocarpa TaxID=122646 RepID=A0ABD3HMA8_9MARC